MSTIDPTQPTPRDEAFDDALRARFADFQDAPAPDAWDVLQVRLPSAPVPAERPPSRWARLQTWRTLGGGMAAGALLMLGVVAVRPEGQLPTHAGSVVTSQQSVSETDVAVKKTRGPGSETGSSASETGIPVKMTGGPVAETGALLPVTGVPVKMMTGGPVAETGVSLPETGVPVKVTGGSVRQTGKSVSVTGQSVVNPLLQGSGAADSLVTKEHHAAPALPATVIGWLRATRRDSVLRKVRAAALAVPADTALAQRAQGLMLAQTQELAALGRALDSLKRALPVPPPLPATTDSAARRTVSAATLPPPSKWAVVLAAETTPSWSVLPSHSVALPAQREQTATSLSQSMQVQYQTDNPRWRWRAGAGQSVLQTQLRTVAERSGERTVTDSVLTADVHTYQTTTSVDLIRRDTVVVYEPILNGSAQLIGYDTTYLIHADTVRTITTTTVNDTVHRKVVTHRTEAYRERQQQLFRPTYRFWTLPLAVQYALVVRPRWRLGLTAGAQVAVFRGGSRPVLNAAGDAYELRPVTAREAGFRPVSLSVSGGLEAEYRFSPRLSALVAPTVRWGVVPAGQSSEAASLRTLLPAAVVGLSYGF